MKSNKSINLPEYLSLILVLSYFLIHNIYILFLGIFISLYEINRTNIDNLLGIKKEKYIKEMTMIIKTKEEESSLSLVEKIEECGYIPSSQETRNNHAA